MAFKKYATPKCYVSVGIQRRPSGTTLLILRFPKPIVGEIPSNIDIFFGQDEDWGKVQIHSGDTYKVQKKTGRDSSGVLQLTSIVDVDAEPIPMKKFKLHRRTDLQVDTPYFEFTLTPNILDELNISDTHDPDELD